MAKNQTFDVCPFTIVIDSNETAAYTFREIRNASNQPMVIATESQALWSMHRRDVTIVSRRRKTMPDVLTTERIGLADYTIRGHELDIQIERKSIPDLFGTLADRRDRFECEIKRLHEDCRFACVVVEGDWSDITRYRETRMLPKSVVGTITAWEQRYPTVHWRMAPGRAAAELMTFRILHQFWKEHIEK